MVDLVDDLGSFTFEAGLTDAEKELLYLRVRASGLTFCGCAHAVFLCKLFQSLRCIIKSHNARDSLASGEDSGLCVGILGMGHMGRQLLFALLEKSAIDPSRIKISTRRPESAVESIPMAGVECFFDNRRLAAWADILFLCCLPSHLTKVCEDLHSQLSKRCLVYSFCSAVPVARLAQLLGHDFVLKPQYDFMACDTADLWLSCTHLTSALTDPWLIEASCPLTMSGGISLGLKWMCALLYSLLNICTYAGLGSADALSLVSSVLREKWPHTVGLKAQSFVSVSCASSLLKEKPFPWISLTDAQTKETPLLCFISSCKPMQQCLSAVYRSLLYAPAAL